MAENSGIEWTHHTFNPWWGCASQKIIKEKGRLLDGILWDQYPIINRV